MRALLFCLPLFLSLAACGEDPKEDTAPPEDTQPEDDGVIGFADDVQPLLDLRCVTCHRGANPAAGKDFSSYEGVMASGTVVANDSANSELVTFGSHHGSGWFTTEEITTISTWIDAGALDD